MITARRCVSTQQTHTNLRSVVRHGAFVLLAALSVCIAACGGGGGSSSGGGNNNGALDTSSLPPAPSQQPISATSGATNTVPVSVGFGVAGAPNIPTVSVTVCVHSNPSNCTTIPNVLVDTESFGLRLVASALQSLGSQLPATPVAGGTLAECMGFADGYTWGTVRNADVHVGSETASNIPIQVLGDLSGNPAPCTHFGAERDSASEIAANGILGIGVAPWDCGADCQNNASDNMYYACPNSGSCTQTPVATGNQVANPIPHFTTDNNGVILEMQPLPYAGATSATGTLVFGIGTQSNNVMDTSQVQVFQTDGAGDFNSTFNGRALNAFIDSGSNALFFADSAIPQCGGAILGSFYCPPSPLWLGATLTGIYGASSGSGSASFAVVSAAALLGSNGNTGNFATNDLAGQYGSSADLDLGLPFFYGRYVYFGQDQTATGGQSPFVAF
jgi:hypothetical protein